MTPKTMIPKTPTSKIRTSKVRITTRFLGGVAALSLLAAACANRSPENEQAADVTSVAPAATDAPDQQPAATTPGVAVPGALLGRSGVGDLMIGPDGRTLYGFTNDVEAASTCYDACAEAWPPVIVDRNWSVGPGLDIGIFATTVREDGSLQLVAGKWPLYYYVGDAALGDLNGQGSGEVWFAVAPDGQLITDAAPAGDSTAEDPTAEDPTAEDTAAGTPSADSPLATGSTDVGEVLVDEAGLTLYGFTNDVDGEPSCYDGCAEAWPPLLVDGLPAGADPAQFAIATRSDGSTQLVAGRWPLYRFAGDTAPGDTNGQGSGGVWFAVAPDGSLIGRDGGGSGSNSGEDAGASVTVDEEEVTVSEGY